MKILWSKWGHTQVWYAGWWGHNPMCDSWVHLLKDVCDEENTILAWENQGWPETSA